MKWQLDTSRPIYLQIIDRVRIDIASGRYHPGQQLPSVRDFAMDAGVNPNTMQKAFAELERSGLVRTQRTSGRFITEDEELIRTMKDEIAENEIRHFLRSMSELGITRQELLEKLQQEREPESGNASVGVVEPALISATSTEGENNG